MENFAGGFDFYPEAGKTFEEGTRERLERQHAYCVLSVGQGAWKHRD